MSEIHRNISDGPCLVAAVYRDSHGCSFAKFPATGHFREFKVG